MFDTRTRLFFFACQKDAAGAGVTLKSRLRLRLSAPTNKKIVSFSATLLVTHVSELAGHKEVLRFCTVGNRLPASQSVYSSIRPLPPLSPESRYSLILHCTPPAPPRLPQISICSILPTPLLFLGSLISCQPPYCTVRVPQIPTVVSCQPLL